MTAPAILTVPSGLVLQAVLILLLLAVFTTLFYHLRYRKRMKKKLHKLMGRLAVKSDHTARAMMESNGKFKKLIMEMNEGLILTDASRNIVFANKCACDILKMPEKRICGTKLSALAPGASESSKIEELLGSKSPQGNAREEMQLIRGDDEIIWVLLSISYPKDIREITGGAIIVITDITSHITLERKMHKLTSYMVQKVRQQECIYDIQQLVNDPGIEASSLFKKAARIIPKGLRWGNDMRVKIEFLEAKYSSHGYRDTECMYRAPLSVDNKKYGNISISFTGHALKNAKPFRLGEKVMLKNIADKIAGSQSARRLIEQPGK